MKRLILIAISIFIVTLSYSQTNFQWDKIDSIAKNKNELYSLTKMYIGEKWRSAQDVIQNDDKEGGAILVKGLSIQKSRHPSYPATWTFSYNVKFLFKDNKYRLEIDNVYCQSARAGQYEWAHMPVSDAYPTEKGRIKTGVSEKVYLEIMANLKSELQSIVDSYEKYLINKNSSSNNGDW